VKAGGKKGGGFVTATSETKGRNIIAKDCSMKTPRSRRKGKRQSGGKGTFFYLERERPYFAPQGQQCKKGGGLTQQQRRGKALHRRAGEEGLLPLRGFWARARLSLGRFRHQGGKSTLCPCLENLEEVER